MWTCKGLKTAKQSWGKKEQNWNLMLPYFETSHKASKIMTVLYWQKDRHIAYRAVEFKQDWESRYKFWTLIFTVNWCSPRSQDNSDGERVVFSTMELEKLSISYKKKKKRLTELNMLRGVSQIQLKAWFYKCSLWISHTHSFTYYL